MASKLCPEVEISVDAHRIHSDVLPIILQGFVFLDDQAKITAILRYVIQPCEQKCFMFCNRMRLLNRNIPHVYRVRALGTPDLFRKCSLVG